MLLTAWILLIVSIIMIWSLFGNATSDMCTTYLDGKLLSLWIIIFAICVGIIFGGLFR